MANKYTVMRQDKTPSNKLTKEQIEALVTIALRGGKRLAHWNYKRFNQLAEKGLTKVTNKGKVYNTHQLTEAGYEAIMSLTDADASDIYPRVGDIQHAKRWVKYLRGDIPEKPF